MKPTWRSAGDPSRLNRVASRRSSLRFGRHTPGIPPSRALSAGRLLGLGAHVGSTTGCSPRRCAPLIVAFRSAYTRYSSLTRLVSRAPSRPRRSRGFHHGLFPFAGPGGMVPGPTRGFRFSVGRLAAWPDEERTGCHSRTDFLAENKMVQLRTAVDIGFRIPSTVVTNSARAALRYLPEGAGFALKGLDTVLWRQEDHQYFCFTQLLDAGALQTSDLSQLPTIVQEQIRPKTDVRVTIVGDRVWAAAITDRDGPIDGDWRILHDHVVYTEHPLPDEVREQCVGLARRLHLSFAAIDLAQVGEDYVYLEVNPVGEWAWLAESLGWDVAHAIAAWLSEDESRNGFEASGAGLPGPSTP